MMGEGTLKITKTMKYFLKKDLPGIKAGTEMRKVEWSKDVWFAVDSEREVIIYPSELSDWIEERADSMWKPKEDELYYTPNPERDDKYSRYHWCDDKLDNWCFSRNLVCLTPELAIELAERMIETAKKFWEEKK